MMLSKKAQGGAFIVASFYLTKFSRDLYLPALPAIMIAFSTSSTYVQYTVTAYYLSLALSRILWTPLSDIYGRRRILFIVVPIFIGGSIVCMVSDDIFWFILGRIIQAIGIGCLTSIGRVIVNDLYGKEKTTKAIAFLTTLGVWAPALATVIGGHLQDWFSWRADFVFLTVVGFLLMIQCIYALPETNEKLQPTQHLWRDMLRNYKQLLSIEKYRRYLLSFCCIASGTVVYFTASPFLFIHSMNIDPVTYGYFAFVTVSGMLIGQLIAGTFSEHLGIDKTLLLGISICLLAGISLIIIAFFGILNIPAVLIPCGIYFIGMGAMSPATKAATMVIIPTLAGAGSALLGVTQGLSSAAVSVAVAHLHERDAMPMGLLLTLLSMMALLIFIYPHIKTRWNNDKTFIKR